MTENEIRQKVVDTAKAWLGYKQSNGTHRKIIDTYNGHKPLARGYKVTYTDAWCATYVSAVAIKSGITDIMFTECSCPQMINLYKKAGRWVENDAYADVKPGDIVMYDWNDSGSGDNKGTADHVGIVTAINGNTMTIIEGNYSYAVKTRTLKVNGLYIRGYCCPDYASKADGKTEAVTNATYTITASGQFTSEAAANDALAKIKALGFTGTISKKETAAPAREISKGNTVRVKRGAKDYDSGNTFIPIVYDRNHVVHSMKGDRVVIAVGKTIIGAVHKDNLTLIEG